VRSASLLISCGSPASAETHEIEGWLARTVAELGPDQGALYRASFPQPRSANPATGRRWLVAIFEPAAVDSARMTGVLAEMRLLGLKPAVFRPGGLPTAGGR
jgi:hypothetical protein